MTNYCDTCDKNYKTKQSLSKHYISQSHIDMINGVKKNYCFCCDYKARDSDKYKRHCKTKKHLKNEDLEASKIKRKKHSYTEDELDELEEQYLFSSDFSLREYSKEVDKYDLYREEYKKHKSMKRKWDKIQFCLDNFCEIMKHNSTELYFKNIYKEWELISMKQYTNMLIELCDEICSKENKVIVLYKIKNKIN